QQLGIKEIYIEKDYWVTFALFNIFKNDIGKETVFKGGTALSKCFGMIRKTAHHYPRTFTGHFGQVRDIIIVESTWLGNFEPYTTANVSSFIYEMMLQNSQQLLIDEYGMNPFEVLALNPKRTLCEKMMSLVRFSQTQQPIADLRNKIRHTYDIHLMLKDENLKSFFQSDEFETMLLRVANDDITSFKNNNEWLANHPTTAIIFSD